MMTQINSLWGVGGGGGGGWGLGGKRGGGNPGNTCAYETISYYFRKHIQIFWLILP